MRRYFRHKLENLIVVNNVVTIHYFDLREDSAVVGGEVHDFWELLYVDKGTVICQRDGQEIKVEEGSIVFHKPNEYHVHSRDGQTVPKILIISYGCRSREMRFFEGKKIPLTGVYVEMLYKIIEEAKKTFDIANTSPDDLGVKLLDNPTLGGQQLIKNYLEIFLISLMRSLSETARGPETFLRGDETSPHSIVGVIKILEDEVEGKVTIGEICARVGYSRAYLFKEFKLATGKTIMEYYRELKINRAKKLLRRGDLSVKQIAEALSFDTANYFVKTFKRLTGVTPLAYKKTYSAKERR